MLGVSTNQMDAVLLQELVARAGNRDADAFDALIDAYGPRLYGYFYRLVGSREESEDLLQELFLRVVRTIDRYEHQDQFDAWLFRIATNLVRDRIRRLRRRPVGVSLAESDEWQLDATDARTGSRVSSPVEDVERDETVDRLGVALEALSDSDREIVMLRHFSQMTFQQIANVLGSPLGTVLARGHRALAKLRTIMEAQ